MCSHTRHSGTERITPPHLRQSLPVQPRFRGRRDTESQRRLETEEFPHLHRLWLGTVRVCASLCCKPSLSRGHSSQGSPQPSPGILLQQHLALVVFKALGTEHFPASNLVKQKLSLVSVSKKNQRNP